MGPPDEMTLEKFKKDPKMSVFEPKGENLKRWEEAIQPVIEKWKKEKPGRAELLKTLHEELDKIRAAR